MSRAERRANTERVKARFYRKQRAWPLWATTAREAGTYVNHVKRCSCDMCGNPRRRWGKGTLAEARADIAAREWDD